MNLKSNKFFSYLILISALSLSLSTMYCSVIGFMKIFAGQSLIVGIICSCLEISKVIIAGALSTFWKKLIILKKIYLFTALIILLLITSVGIYGFLSSAYQDTTNKDLISTTKIESLNSRKTKFEEQRNDLLSEKKLIDSNYSDLNNSFTKNISNSNIKKSKNTEYINSVNSKNINKQLNFTSNRKENISNKINSLTDSVNNIDLQIINLKSSNLNSSELSSLKYISNLTNYPMDKIVNIFIFLIIFVFDPLALMLVTVYNDTKYYSSIESTRTTPESNPIENLSSNEINTNSVEDLVKKYSSKKKKIKKIDSTEKITEESIPEENISTEQKTSPKLTPHQKRNMSHQEVETFLKNNL